MAEKVPVEKIFSVELSDAYHEIKGTLFEDTRDNRTLIGEGHQDVVGFIRTLQKMGFDGAYGVEILSSEQRSRSLHEGLKLAHDSAVRTFELAAS
jgi:sugar phosphate isomerase/epimerase